MSHSHTANIDAIKRIPDPKEPKPRLALPTFALFAGALAAWVGSTVLAATGLWPWPISTIVNTVAAFALFTVVHDAAHSTLSRIRPVNVWIGRMATFTLNPGIGFRAFRYIHMQHHRFTNHEDGRDPDHYASCGPGWQAPLRWMTMDLAYMRWYIPRLSQRPRTELVEFAVTLLAFAAVIAGLVLSGNFLIVGLACWLIPSRLAGFALGWSFDYLPHHGLKDRPTDDRFKTTRNRIGLERLLSPPDALPELSPGPSPSSGNSLLPLHSGLAAKRGGLPLARSRPLHRRRATAQPRGVPHAARAVRRALRRRLIASPRGRRSGWTVRVAGFRMPKAVIIDSRLGPDVQMVSAASTVGVRVRRLYYGGCPTPAPAPAPLGDRLTR
jgi:ring-1,2-phenylacetyl-CoA epoxidase subunit PaaE